MSFNINNSSLAATMTCERKGALGRLLHRTTRTTAIKPRCGQSIHKYLHHVATQGFDGALGVFQHDYQDWIDQNISESYYDRPYTYDNVVKILSYYQQQVEEQGWPWDEVLAGEQIIKRPLTDSIMVYGTVDLLVSRLGRVSVVDHKTTGRLDSDWGLSQKMSTQGTEYVWLAQEEHPDCHQFSINGISIATIPEIRYKKDGGEYTCGVHKTVYSECQAKHANFQVLGPWIKQDWMIDEWKSMAEPAARRLHSVAHWQPEDILKEMKPTGKFSSGVACKYCEFKDLCQFDITMDLVESMTIPKVEKDVEVYE